MSRNSCRIIPSQSYTVPHNKNIIIKKHFTLTELYFPAQQKHYYTETFYPHRVILSHTTKTLLNIRNHAFYPHQLSYMIIRHTLYTELYVSTQYKKQSSITALYLIKINTIVKEQKRKKTQTNTFSCDRMSIKQTNTYCIGESASISLIPLQLL